MEHRRLKRELDGVNVSHLCLSARFLCGSTGKWRKGLSAPSKILPMWNFSLQSYCYGWESKMKQSTVAHNTPFLSSNSPCEAVYLE